MLKNNSGQKIGAQMVSATDGSAFTGSVTVAVTVDAGTQATGSVGSGACTHEGGGYHTYAPAQAETNGDLIAFTFSGTGAVPVTIQVYTLPTTGVLAPTVLGRTLDVSSGGEAGLDWANIGSPTTSVVLSGTTIGTLTTYTGNTPQTGDSFARLTGTGAVTFSSLTVTNATTLSGAVSLGSTLSVSGTTSFAAMTITGTGSSSGLTITGGPTCTVSQGALQLIGGSTSGAGMSMTTTDGHGLVITGTGSARHGLYITSGSSGVSNAIYAAVPGGSGFGIRATTVDVISNVSVGGTTTLTGAVTASNASNNITGITASTVSDKTGYRLSATGVDDIWDEAQSGHATAGTFGKYLDAAISGVSTGGVSAADIADAVWDEARSGHVSAGSFGEYVLAKTHGDANIAVASTALSTAQWTNARAGYLDNINNSNLASVPAFPSNFASMSITAAGLVSTTSNVKKNQALSSFMFLMTDSTNHAPAAGLTVTVTRSIDGGAFASGTLSSVTEVSAGMYKVDFAAADLNGNVIVLKATATGADTTLERIVTQP